MPQCDICGYESETERGVNTHKGHSHNNNEQYVCDDCGFHTDSKKGFSLHRSQKHDVDFTVEVECDVCGELIERRKNKHKNSFCSKECETSYRTGREQDKGLVEKRSKAQRDRVEVECDYCGNTLERTHKRVEKHEHQFCDDACHGEYISKTNVCSNHPRWSGGESGIDFVRKHISDTHWKKIAARVREKYDNTCQKCGHIAEDGDRSLDVHHIVPLTAGGTNDEELLMPLCLDCHRTVESYTDQFVDNYFVQ